MTNTRKSPLYLNQSAKNMLASKYALKWEDQRGNSISESSCHEGMFIVETGKEKFFSIQSSREIMLNSHPPKEHGKTKVGK